MKYRICLALLALGALPSFAAATVHLLQKPAMNQNLRLSSPTRAICGPSAARAAWRTRLTGGAGTEAKAAFSPDGSDHRLHRRIRRQRGRLHHARGGRHAQAHHVSSRRRPRGGMDAGRQAHSVPLESRGLLALHAALHGLAGRRPAGRAAAAHGLHRSRIRPDGKRMVYAPLDGGQFATDRQQLRRLETLSRRRSQLSVGRQLLPTYRRRRFPRTDSNDFDPMWIGDKIYFLSDRNGPVDAVSLRSAIEEGG